MCLAIDAKNTVEIWGFYFGIIYHILEIRFGIFLRAAMKKNQIDWFEIETGTLCKSNMACWKITNLLRCFSINHKYIYIHTSVHIYIYIHIAIKLICLITPVCLLDYSKQQTDAEKGLQGSCSMMFAEQFPGSWLFGIVLRVPCNQTNLNRTYRGSQWYLIFLMHRYLSRSRLT